MHIGSQEKEIDTKIEGGGNRVRVLHVTNTDRAHGKPFLSNQHPVACLRKNPTTATLDKFVLALSPWRFLCGREYVSHGALQSVVRETAGVSDLHTSDRWRAGAAPV